MSATRSRGAVGWALAAMLLPSVVGAASPNQVNYQGQLKSGGSLYTGTAQMKFAVVDGGVSLWSNDSTSVGGAAPTNSVTVSVVNGLFAVMLGALPMKPITGAAINGATAAALRVWVSTGGGFEQLTDQPITSVPFVLGEASAPDGLWASNDGSVYRSSGNVGIGTEMPATPLHVSGMDPDLTLDMLSASPNNQLELRFAVDGVTQSRILMNRANNALALLAPAVGIGTTTPGNTLDVMGGAAFQGNHVFIRNPSSPAGKQTWGMVVNSSSGILSLGNAMDVPPESGSLTKTVMSMHPSAPANSLVIDSGGNTSVSVLRITGGADLAELFTVEEEAEPGSVLAIDPLVPGRLVVCDEAQSRKVAGVVGGAGGLSPGVLLGETCSDELTAPVALSGRVWVKADATDRPIHVGDLLVSAPRAGHAAAARNPTKAAGRILGKAMSNLEAGTGLVLVLVSVQ